jgi:RES domain-containing protein
LTVVWRIATDTPDYVSEDLAGLGAKKTGGRWNRAGAAVVYCADCPALACLETLAHAATGGLPLNRYLIGIEVPAAVWKKREKYDAGSAPAGWDARPAGKISLDFGDRWIADRRSLVLELPSVVAAEHRVLLLNPEHPEMKKARIVSKRLWSYDPRFEPLFGNR